MKFTTLAKARKETGFQYLGKINNGAKHEKAFKYKELVYSVYLAPASSSGYEVCAGRTLECTKACLNHSGQNRLDVKKGHIDRARIGKTQMFFENHKYFVDWMIYEIKLGIAKAAKMGYTFSVRINNTSDISPEMFYIKDENGIKTNILELFPQIQFYDYTKIQGRINLMNKYHNYDVTYSYNGSNMEQCKALLKAGVKVAMVFEKVPEYFMGYKVVNGDLYDMRYKDQAGSIIGLKFKTVREKLEKNNTFVIREKELVLESV